MLYLSLGSVIIAIILFALAYRERQKAGIPTGRVIYTDASQWMKVEKPLFNKELRLTGKPDYLVQRGKQVIPIEIKSGKAPHEPRQWHIAQLAAYCLLVKGEYGMRPSQGILRYADRTMAITFTAQLEASTRKLIGEMQQRVSQMQIERSHHDQNRCANCGHRSRCDQALRI